MSHFSNNFNKGFTLVEMLVSLGIMGSILSVVLLNQSSYTERIALSNLADQMSLTLYQAQSYGIAVKEFETGSENFSVAYGLTVSILSNGDESAYLNFADEDGDGTYDGNWNCQQGGSSECLEKVTFSQNNTINSICIIENNGSEDCNQPKRVDITFARPNTRANIEVFRNSGQSMDMSTAKGIKINLQSLSGFERAVVVYKVGQISSGL